ncbi:hypothetical protein AB0A74_03285 [Saccharothrix sp. NPDC042600]|uniref:hypothetical protein n=1 Tax=Saccharothrix TaxID=2071 RepID=UPI0033F5423E|nr:hypothetical protein GCM10017745_68010 [Saccharothrix mutabilis subsp. capreolus]
MSGVGEAESWCAAECDDPGMDDTVEAGVGADSAWLIGCSASDVGMVLVPAFLVDADPAGVVAVQAAHAGAFTAAELPHRQAAGVRVRE